MIGWLFSPFRFFDIHQPPRVVAGPSVPPPAGPRAKAPAETAAATSLMLLNAFVRRGRFRWK